MGEGRGRRYIWRTPPRATETRFQHRRGTAIIAAGLKERGSPDDLAKLIGADDRRRVIRTYVEFINHVATYLGISRYAVEKLLKAGKLRQFTVQSTTKANEIAIPIRVDDVVALK
jgi:hypothetical protein